MAGLGFVLGGALQGFGQGLAAQGQQQWQERREIALEKLRSQNRTAEMQEQGRINDQNNASSTERKLQADLTTQANDQNFRAGLAREGAKAAAAAQESEQAFKERMARLESALRTNQAVAEINARATSENKQVFDIKTDEITGANFAILKDGTSVPLDKTISRKLPRASDSGSSSAFDRSYSAPAPAKPTFRFDPKTGEFAPVGGV